MKTVVSVVPRIISLLGLLNFIKMVYAKVSVSMKKALGTIGDQNRPMKDPKKAKGKAKEYGEACKEDINF